MHGMLKNAEMGLYKYQKIIKILCLLPLYIKQYANSRNTFESIYFTFSGELRFSGDFEPLVGVWGRGTYQTEHMECQWTNLHFPYVQVRFTVLIDFKKEETQKKRCKSKWHQEYSSKVSFPLTEKPSSNFTFYEVTTPIGKLHLKISRCLEREGCRWVRIKKGEYV